MSERGSFVTEYIYCTKCLEVASEVLVTEGDFISTELPYPGSDFNIPIIAGKIEGLYAGEELDVFEFEFLPKLAERICHKLRVAVIAEQGERIFTILPPAG